MNIPRILSLSVILVVLATALFAAKPPAAKPAVRKPAAAMTLLPSTQLSPQQAKAMQQLKVKADAEKARLQKILWGTEKAISKEMSAPKPSKAKIDALAERSGKAFAAYRKIVLDEHVALHTLLTMPQFAKNAPTVFTRSGMSYSINTLLTEMTTATPKNPPPGAEECCPGNACEKPAVIPPADRKAAHGAKTLPPGKK